MSHLDVVAVLQRNEGLFKKSKSGKDMQKMINDPNTSPELRGALQTILNDPELKARLDSAKQGRTDGKIGLGDIRVLSKSPEVIEHNRMKAQSFMHNYIPSDGSVSSEAARQITANDAMRELYKYSDNLPKKTSLRDLQDIVDGTGHQNKRPPQLVAAAQYMLDNPEAWKSLTGKEGEQRISRAGLCDALGRNVQMSASENKALDTIEKNAKDFFDGKTFDRSKLQKIISDPASKPDNVEAAKKLLDDPVLFGMLDNAKRGHKSNGWRTSDDGMIGRKDLKAFREKMNKTPAPDQATTSSAFNDPSAVNEMRNGQLNQPDVKTVKGGGLKKLVSGAMKVYSTFQKISSEVMGAIAALKIPLVSQAAAAGSMVSNAISGGVDIARTAINDGNVKLAAAKAAMSFGSQAISVATAPGAGKVATVAGREIVDVAVKKAVKETGKELAEEIAQDQGEQFLNDRHPA
jgi:type III secretion translocon protein HrpF